MVERIDGVFKALGDPIRLQIVETLSKGPASVGTLAQPHHMSLAGASKHISLLEAAGLIVRERKGRVRVCTLQPEALFAARS